MVRPSARAPRLPAHHSEVLEIRVPAGLTFFHGREAMSGPEVEADLALVQLQTSVEGPAGPRLEALEHLASAATKERLRRAGADALAGDRLPDGELAPVPPAAAAVRLLLLGDLGA